MTWLEFLNRYILQFFWVRLFRVKNVDSAGAAYLAGLQMMKIDTEKNIKQATNGADVLNLRKHLNKVNAQIIYSRHKLQKEKFRLGGWIEPFSGWGESYKWHGRVLFGKKIN